MVVCPQLPGSRTRTKSYQAISESCVCRKVLVRFLCASTNDLTMLLFPLHSGGRPKCCYASVYSDEGLSRSASEQETVWPGLCALLLLSGQSVSCGPLGIVLCE